MEEVCLCDVEDPVDVSGPNVAMSAVQVERTNLSKCCKRLDESVTQQRKYANKVTRLNYKIQDYRYRSATSLDMISHVAAADLSNFDSYEFSPLHSCRSEMWDVNSDLTYFTMTAHLNDERKINEEYCAQLDKERRRNLRLQQEIEHLRHKIESNTRENEKALQLHDMNIARKEEENRRKMNDVKSDLESVRRQLSDLTRQSTKDMEKQKADFFQLLTEISDVLRHHQWANTHDRKFVLPEVLDDLINSSNLRDADLADSIRRFRQWRRKAEGAWRNTNDNSETEINRGLVRKYDESMERIAELESKLSESQRKLMALESRLKDEEDFSKKYQRSLCKLYCLVEGTASTELIEEVRDGSGLKEEKMKRIPHIEVMNTIRKAFRNKDTELRELSVRIGVLCDQNVDLENKLVNSEKERKDVCDQLQYMRKELEEK